MDLLLVEVDRIEVAVVLLADVMDMVPVVKELGYVKVVRIVLVEVPRTAEVEVAPDSFEFDSVDGLQMNFFFSTFCFSFLQLY